MCKSNLDKLGLEPDPIDGRHPFSAKELAKFEKAFKHKLPDDYVDLLRLHNGDWPKNEPTFRDGEYEYLRPEGEVEIDRSVGEWSNLWVQLRKRGKTLGPGVVPIAETTSSAPILLVHENNNKVWVGFLDVENGPPARKRIERLADTFTDFINLLEVK